MLHKCKYCGAETTQPDWMCYKAPITYRQPTEEDYKPGVKYQAYMGYGWVDVEVGKNGFNPLDNFLRASQNGMTRIKTT